MQDSNTKKSTVVRRAGKSLCFWKHILGSQCFFGFWCTI